MVTFKIITQEEYDQLPGNGAAALLNAVGRDGQPILKYAKGHFKDGTNSIEKYWIDENGKWWQRASKFKPGEIY